MLPIQTYRRIARTSVSGDLRDDPRRRRFICTRAHHTTRDGRRRRVANIFSFHLSDRPGQRRLLFHRHCDEGVRYFIQRMKLIVLISVEIVLVFSQHKIFLKQISCMLFPVRTAKNLVRFTTSQWTRSGNTTAAPVVRERWRRHSRRQWLFGGPFTPRGG